MQRADSKSHPPEASEVDGSADRTTYLAPKVSQSSMLMMLMQPERHEAKGPNGRKKSNPQHFSLTHALKHWDLGVRGFNIVCVAGFEYCPCTVVFTFFFFKNLYRGLRGCHFVQFFGCTHSSDQMCFSASPCFSWIGWTRKDMVSYYEV